MNQRHWNKWYYDELSESGREILDPVWDSVYSAVKTALTPIIGAENAREAAEESAKVAVFRHANPFIHVS